MTEGWGGDMPSESNPNESLECGYPSEPPNVPGSPKDRAAMAMACRANNRARALEIAVRALEQQMDWLMEHFASADTHPKGGDVKQAPAPLSGAVGVAETPKPHRSSQHERG